MVAALGGEEQIADFMLLLSGGIGKGHIEHGSFYMNVDMHETVPRLQLGACFHGVVQEVSDDDAEIHIGHGKGGRNLGLGFHLDLLAFHQGYLAVQDGVRHGVAGLYDGIDGQDGLVDFIQIASRLFVFAAVQLGGECLDVIVPVMFPTAHGAVDVLYLSVMLLYQSVLIFIHFPVFTSKHHIDLR